MKCWFCLQPLGEKEVWCQTQNCHSHYVTYIFNDSRGKSQTSSLFKVQFKATILTKDFNLKEFFVSYLLKDRSIEVVEQITPPYVEGDESVSIAFQYKDVFKVKCGNRLILTPENFREKLPLLITIS